MSDFQKWFRANFSKMPADVKRTGLGLWFQIVEERFMPLFWTNLVTVLWLAPCFACLFFFVNMWDYLTGILSLVFFILAGPGITAVHFVCMKTVRGIPVWWWEDYKSSVRRDWKKAMLFSALAGMLLMSFVYAVRILVTVNGGLGKLQFILFVIIGFLISGFVALGFQQLSTVELKFGHILRNAMLLMFAGGKRSFFTVLFAFICNIIAAKFYMYTPVALLAGLYALAVMTDSLIFLPVFREFFPEDEE